MAWSTPTSPITGTTITVAFANSLIDAINWLRQLTGGADPGGSNQVIYSTSTTTATWGALPDAAMANQKVNRGGDTMQGTLHISGVGPLPDGTTYASAHMELQGLSNSAPMIGFHRPGVSAVTLYESGGELHQVSTGGATGKLWTAANDGAGSGLDADLLDGQSSAYYATAADLTARVPSGVVVIWKTGTAPTGWVFETDMDNKFPLGAGSSYSLGDTGGAADHVHTIDHTHAATATGSPGSGAVQSGGASTANPGNHTHTIPALGAGNSGTTSHLPPYRVVNYIRKS